MSKIVDFFMQNARTIGIVYAVGAVVVFLAMTVFYIWVDRVSKKEQELYYDEYYCPALMGDMTDRNTEEFDKEENK